jgi:hypothetical protein
MSLKEDIVKAGVIQVMLDPRYCDPKRKYPLRATISKAAATEFVNVAKNLKPKWEGPNLILFPKENEIS